MEPRCNDCDSLLTEGHKDDCGQASKHLQLTEQEMDRITEALGEHERLLREHWRFERNHEPEITREVAEVEALRKRLEGRRLCYCDAREEQAERFCYCDAHNGDSEHK